MMQKGVVAIVVHRCVLVGTLVVVLRGVQRLLTTIRCGGGREGEEENKDRTSQGKDGSGT